MGYVYRNNVKYPQLRKTKGLHTYHLNSRSLHDKAVTSQAAYFQKNCCQECLIRKVLPGSNVCRTGYASTTLLYSEWRLVSLDRGIRWGGGKNTQRPRGAFYGSLGSYHVQLHLPLKCISCSRHYILLHAVSHLKQDFLNI
jgi:hypothetical protein